MASLQASGTRPAAPPKQENFVEGQIQKAVRRIRTFDVLAALFVFLAGSLVYGLALILLDSWLTLPAIARTLAFAGYVAAALLYLFFGLVRPLCRPLNPHYAAVQVEHTLAGAKNSVVNWLDLKDRPIPGAIRGAIAARAARDMSRADIDRAISSRRAGWSGGALFVMLMTGVIVLSILGPKQFFSLFERAFAPFLGTDIAAQTQIEIVSPEGGNAAVPVGQPVNFVVRVTGRVPSPEARDALKLNFRYSQTEPVFQERILVPGDKNGEWTCRLLAAEIHNGFFYKISGGDALTPEYQVQVKSSPMITGFEVVYKHRPYLRKPVEKTQSPDLVGWRGTEVTLTAKTNRKVKEGRLLIDGVRDLVHADVVPEDPEALRFRLVLEKNGTYRIRFASLEGEHSGDSVSYQIKVTPDNPPSVELTEPGKDVEVPANGTLPLKGKVKDDHGLRDVTLRLRMANGPVLKPKQYQNADYRYTDGGRPTEHDYEDFIALDQLKLDNGTAHKVKEGDIIEYFLEATDDCDYPDEKGQVAQSKVCKIKVAKPVAPQQADKEKQAAEQKQKQHQKETADKRKQEDKQRQQEQKNAGSKPQEPKSPDEQRDDRTKEAIDKENQGQGRGQPKPDDKQGESKGPGKPEPKNGNPPQGDGKQNEPGQARPEPKPPQPGGEKGEQGQPGESHGAQSPDQKQQGESKGPGKPQQGDGAEQNKGASRGAKPSGQKGGDPGVEKAAEQAQSNDPGERQQGRRTLQGIRDKSKDPNARQGAQDALDELNRNATPQDVEQAARQAQGDNPQERLQGKQDLRDMQDAKDPAVRQAAREALNQANQGASKQDVDQAAKQAQSGDPQEKSEGQQALREMKRDAKDPDVKKGAGDALQQSVEKSTKKDADQAGQQAQSGSPEEKQQGRQGLRDMLQHAKDPAVRKQAEDALKEAARKATPEDIARLARDIQEQKKNEPGKKPDPQDLKDIEKLANDPDVRSLAENVLKEMAKQDAAQNAGKPDVDQAAKDLKSADPKQAQAAADKLQDIAQQAQDENVRRQAEEALKQAGKPSERPGQNASPQDAQQAEQDLKSADREKFQEALKQLSDIARNAQDLEAKTLADKAMNGLGLTAGDRQRMEELGMQFAGDRPETAKALQANLEFKKLAAALQLQRLNETVTPEMLKKADVSPEEWERFRRSFQDYQKRIDSDLNDVKKLPPDAPATLRPLGGIRQGTQAGTTPQDLQNAPQTQPPREYRNAYQEFTQELSRMQQKLEKGEKK